MPDAVSQPHDPAFWVVVPAAGTGTRMATDTPKQYLMLGERSVLEHTLDTLLSCARISRVVLVLATNDKHWSAISSRYTDAALQCVSGGAERYHSVLNGLDALAGKAADNDWVLVHDAARPCVQREDIEHLMTTLQDSEQGGLLGVPVADTMKRVDNQCHISSTVDRDGLWHAFTPQMFRLGALRAALHDVIDSGQTVTDEANAMELAGYRPRMVQGARDNIKITLPADLALAAFYLQARSTP